MGFRSFRFQKGLYYHIYNRGCNKQRLFFIEKDWKRFWDIILKYTAKYKLIKIHAWCVLPNHFHFLLSEQKTEEETGLSEQISDFMRLIQGSYAMYFNARYGIEMKQGRKSPVFEGRFKAKPITDKKYLAQVTYYIRHNALKHDIVDDSQDWPWAGVTASEDFPAMKYTGVNPEFDPGFD